MDSTSLGWAAYAAGITVLSGMAALNSTSNQRFAIAPQNSFSLPTTQNTNQLYQNFAIRELAGIVPSNDAVYSPTGNYYDEALDTYLTWAYPILPTDPKLAAEIAQAQSERASLLATIHSEMVQARTQYLQDTQNGIDIYTGEAITLAAYMAIWFPDIADDLQESQDLNTIIQSLQLTASGALETQELNQWRQALAQGQNGTVFSSGYNMPVQITDAGTTASVAEGTTPADTSTAEYVPAWSIGGGYNTVAENWISSFPSSYPSNPTAYYSGASSYSSQDVSSYSDFWENYGYSTSTSVTGDDFLFFSWEDVSTTTTVTQSIDIDTATFGPSVKISAWGIGSFDISMGLWWNPCNSTIDSGNPLETFPQVSSNAPNTTIPNVQQQVTKAVFGYGIEVKFTLYNESFNQFYGYMTTTQQNSGYLSVFGCLFGEGGGSYSSNTYPWDYVTVDNSTQTITLLAQHGGVPQLLGVVITEIPS